MYQKTLNIIIIFNLIILLELLYICAAHPLDISITLQNGVKAFNDIYLGTEDTYLDPQYGPNGNSSEIRTGSANNRRILIRFDLNLLPSDIIINSSKLSLYSFDSLQWKTRGLADTVKLHPVIQKNWEESKAQWFTYDGVNKWLSPGGDFDSSISVLGNIPNENVWVDFDITEIIKSQLTTKKAELLLVSYSPSSIGFRSSEYSDISLRPKLTINYSTNTLIADAGEDLSVSINDVVVLNGTKSQDSGSQKELIYNWSFISKPLKSKLSDRDIFPNNTKGVNGADRPSFTPDFPGDYYIELTVTNSLGFSSKDRVKIVVYPKCSHIHPRIFLSKDKLTELREWITNYNPIIWQNIKSNADKYLTKPEDQISSINYKHFAFVYQITENQQYGRKAIELMLSYINKWENDFVHWWESGGKDGKIQRFDVFPAPWTQDIILYNIAPTYDWISDLFTNEERIRVLNLINKMLYGPAGKRAYFFSNGDFTVYPEVLKVNYALETWAAEFVWALATMGENFATQNLIDYSYQSNLSLGDNVAENFMRDCINAYKAGIVPVYNKYGKGGWLWEGVDYTTINIYDIIYSIHAVRYSLGESVFQEMLNENAWIEDYIYYMIHSTFPSKFPKLGLRYHRYVTGHAYASTDFAGQLLMRDRDLILLVSKAFSSISTNYAYYYLDSSPGALKQRTDSTNINELIFYQPYVKPKNYSELEPFWYAQGMGYIFARSDWSTDATWVSFSAGEAVRYYGSGAELGRFEIHRLGHLTGSPYYNFGTESNLMKVPLLNNCLILGEIIGGDSLFVWNYGGQRGYPEVINYAPVKITEPGKGEFRAIENTISYMYAKADLTKAYLPSLVDEYSRSIVFLRPNYVIIFDNVTTPKENIRKRFLLQFLEPPEIYENTIIRNNGNAKLFAKVLLPENCNITTIGPGWDGNGGTSTANTYWRTEIEPKDVQTSKNTLFLNVFYTADAIINEMPPIKKIENNNLVGVQMLNKLVIFNKSEQNLNLQYTLNFQGTVENLVLNMCPNKSYPIYIDGVLKQSVISNNNGVLTFNINFVGTHTISIGESKAVPEPIINKPGKPTHIDN